MIYQLMLGKGEFRLQDIKTEIEERRKKTKKNIEKILRIFKPKESIIIDNWKTYYSLLSEQSEKKKRDHRNELYFPKLELDMLYHSISSDNDIKLAISRVKTNQSLLDKIIKKKILKIPQSIDEEINNFLKFRLAIICKDNDEAKKLKSAIDSRYSAAKCRIWPYDSCNIASFRKGYEKISNYLLNPLIIKTQTGNFEIDTRGHEELRNLPSIDKISDFICDYIEENKKNRIEAELLIKDFGGINFILEQRIFSEAFKIKSETIKNKISKIGFEIKGPKDKNEKSGYKARHYFLIQPDMEGIELRFTDIETCIENIFGEAYEARYKSNLQKIEIPKNIKDIVNEIYNKLK